jgi:branched-chain amino acid transport system substrate-binding protein
VVGPDTAASREARSAFRGGFKGRVAVVTSRRGEMNFSETLRHIRQVRPDAIYLLHTGGMAVNFLRQFDESGLKKTIPLFGPATTLDQTTLAAAGTAALGAFSVGPWSDDLDVPANRRMVGDFESEYGRLPSLHAAEGYDAAMLLDAALKAVDRKFGDYDALLNALRRADFPSTRGTVRFDTDQFPIQSYYVRQAVEDARERMVNEQRGLLVKDVRDGRSGECAMRWTAETPAKPQGGGR